MKPERSHWFFKDERSDKEYVLELSERDGGWVVDTHYGRRGSALKGVPKTVEPLDYDSAKAVYDAEAKARIKKRYVLQDDGQAYTAASSDYTSTGLDPQLLNPVDRDQLPGYFEDDDWGFQRKYDGHRRGFILSPDARVSSNKLGFAVSYPTDLDAGFDALERYFPLSLDGELIGNVYVIFDVTTFAGRDVRDLPYIDRLSIIEDIADQLPAGGPIMKIETAFTPEQKRALFARMERDRREGVVGKRFSAPYVAGRPNSLGDQVKHKFLEDITAIVLSHSDGKRSVSLGLFDAQGEFVNVGNCTIPPNKPIPEKGATVDVSYLYAYEGGSLFQPVYKCLRDDVNNSECRIDRLKYKRDELDQDPEPDADHEYEYEPPIEMDGSFSM